jgi:hypothetical protein
MPVRQDPSDEPPPPPEEDEAGPEPIDGFINWGARIGTSGWGIQYKPAYFAGDEWKPASLSPDNIAKLQEALVMGGLLSEDDVINVGVWGPDEAEAWKKMLQYANVTGISPLAALHKRAMRGALKIGLDEAARRGGGVVREPLVTSPTNPDDLRQQFGQVAYNMLGHRIAPDVLERMVSTYQQYERDAQVSEYQATGSGLSGGPGGEVVDPPSPEVYAMNETYKADAPGVEARGFVTAANEFFDLLDSPVGG